MGLNEDLVTAQDLRIVEKVTELLTHDIQDNSRPGVIEWTRRGTTDTLCALKMLGYDFVYTKGATIGDDPMNAASDVIPVEKLGKFGHHPDPLIDAQVELDRTRGLLTEAHGGLIRALDYRAATPEGLSIKADVRDCLMRTGYTGDLGLRAAF